MSHELGEWEEELTGFHNSVEEIKKGEKGIDDTMSFKVHLLCRPPKDWKQRGCWGI